MNRLLLLLFLLCLLGCKPIEPQPTAPTAVLKMVFADGSVDVGLHRIPTKGPWAFMDAGVWTPLDIQWTDETRGEVTVKRTAPDWLLLQDPQGRIHRMVLVERPDPVPMPLARRGGDALREEERGALAALGVMWVLSFVRR